FPISNPSVPSSGSKDFQFPIFNMVWGGKDSNGMTVSSGIYFAKLSVQSKGEKFILTKKIIKLQNH
ncbi:hypothetical protein KAX75_08190, partial [candidate division WOR-3 bacterium]|nr:hypothetical protein [candidate division WOR-3 bacterium]